MSQKPREKAASGIYHVMLRGVNRQQIFYEDKDYVKFINLLKHFKNVSGFSIYAYCLMGNHIHLLIKEGAEPLSILFQRIGPSFANWYNPKYERTGHIFEQRFRSEPVDSDSYFLTVMRYILRNPVMAHICSTPLEYQYSNARDLLYDLPTFTDTKELYQYIPKDQLKKFILIESNDVCLDLEENIKKRITNEDAIEMIKEEFGCITPNIGISNSKERIEFNLHVRILKEKGIAVRQLSRLTGIPRRLLE